MAKSRWELEAERKKKAQQQALAAAQQAIKSGAAYKGNAVTDTVKKTATASTAKKTTTTPKASTVTVSKPQGANIPTFLQGSGRTTAEKSAHRNSKTGFHPFKRWRKCRQQCSRLAIACCKHQTICETCSATRFCGTAQPTRMNGHG